MKLSNNLSSGDLMISKKQSSNILFNNVTNTSSNNLQTKINKNKHGTQIGIDFSPSTKIRFKNNDLSRKIREAQEAKSVVQTSDEAILKITDNLKKLQKLISKAPDGADSSKYIDADALGKIAGNIDKVSDENQLKIKNILNDDKAAVVTSKTTTIDNIVNMKYELEGEGAESVLKSVSSINNSCVAPNVAFSGGNGILSSEAATYTIKGNTGTVSVGGSLVINGEEIEITDNYPMTKLAEYINSNKEKFGVTAQLQESGGVNDTNLKLTALGQPGEDSKLTVEYKNGIHPEGPQAGNLEDAEVYGKTVMTSGVLELAKAATYTIRGNSGTVSVGGTLVINDEEIKLTDNYSITKLAEYINNNKEKFGVTAESLESGGVKDTNLKLTALGEAGPSSKLSIEYKDGIHPEGLQAGKLHDTVVHGSDLTILAGEGFVIDGEASKEGDFEVNGNTVTITKEGNSKGLTLDFSKAGADIQHGVAITGASYEHEITTTTTLNVTIGSKASEQYNIEVKDISSKSLKLDDPKLKGLSKSIDDAISKLEADHKYFVAKNNEIDEDLKSLLKKANKQSNKDFDLNFGASRQKDNNLFAELLVKIKKGLLNDSPSNMISQSNSIDKNSVLKLLR